MKTEMTSQSLSIDLKERCFIWLLNSFLFVIIHEYFLLPFVGISPHQCRFCQKIFTRKEHLNNHEMIHTGISPHKCEFCNKVIGRIGQSGSIHCDVSNREWSRLCPFQTFTRKEHLTNHLKHHSGDNPHVCTICNKPFTRKEHLINHMRSVFKFNRLDFASASCELIPLQSVSYRRASIRLRRMR